MEFSGAFSFAKGRTDASDVAFWGAAANAKNSHFRGTWLAQSMECVTLDLRVRSSSSTLGVELPLKKRTKNSKEKIPIFALTLTYYSL